MQRDLSKAIYERSCRVIPGGVNSPVRSFPDLGEIPLVAESGDRDLVTDVDGYSYIDFCGSWGALIHGHAHPDILQAATERLKMGSTFGITTAIEAEFAELIVQEIPHIEKIRFVSSGTEAAMSVVRLARGFTGRNLIIKFAGHYHGHSDSFLIQAGSGVLSLSANSSSAGVPHDFVQHTLSLPFNDFEAIQLAFNQFGSQIAAVILEPVAANMGVVTPESGYLDNLRTLTEKHGSLLIFDEVISGFRLSLGGAASHYQIEPDLCCYGKIIGGGFPAAAFGGRRDVMDHLAPLGSVYQAGTLSGNPVAMAAGYQSVLLCKAPFFYRALKEKTDDLLCPIREFIERKKMNVALQQCGSLFTLFFGRDSVKNLEEAKKCDKETFCHFFQTLFSKGIYVAPSQFEANFVSVAHTDEHIAYARDSILEALQSIDKCI